MDHESQGWQAQHRWYAMESGKNALFLQEMERMDFNLRHLSELPLLGEPTGTDQPQLALTIEAELEPETVK